MNVLRPSAEEAAAAWHELVVAEREQVERLPDRPRPEDFYGPIAKRFKADPHRADEPLLDELRSLVRPGEAWMDIGAGGGRYTLPIALLAGRVVAVEPSAGMRAALSEAAQEHGIENLDVFDERWPGESHAPVADVAFISHVGYDIAEIGGFLDLMDTHATRLCVAVMFSEAPISDWAPLWQAVHDEERHLLPAAGEMMTLLFARGKTPEVSFLDLPPRTYEDLASLHASARRPLWVLPDSERDKRLESAVRDLAVRVEGGYALTAATRRLGVITWRPGD
ncbi:MAG TPA: methyltransferase domain-containing protein [Dehalococcoidia bacterium]|nr:methyltransferase domain-containing protein [Dehalococcoidia bacterium]